MIGRATLSSPWIFRDTWSCLTSGTIPPPPTLRQKVEIMCRHFRKKIELRGERAAVIEFRTRIHSYGKQLRPCGNLKESVRKLDSVSQFEDAVARFLAERESPETGQAPAGPECQ